MDWDNNSVYKNERKALLFPCKCGLFKQPCVIYNFIHLYKEATKNNDLQEG